VARRRKATQQPSQPASRRRIRIPSSIWRRAVYAFALIVAVVLLGTLAMHAIEGWSYLDSFYFTSFIATGQGPPGNLQPDSPLGKVFSSILAFVCVGTVISALLFLFGPFLGRVFREGEEKLEEVEREVREFEKG
jgi:voltage-gated potassium channel